MVGKREKSFKTRSREEKEKGKDPPRGSFFSLESAPSLLSVPGTQTVAITCLTPTPDGLDS